MIFTFTNQQRYLAGHTDLVSWLRSRGEELKHSGSEWEWSYHGERVTVRGNVWFNQYQGEGGDAVQFLQAFYGYSETDAVEKLLDGSMGGQRNYCAPRLAPPKKEQTELKPPAVNSNMRRVFAYLCKTRGISSEIVSEFAHAHTLYESAEHHNCLFVGRDESSKTAHVCARGTNTNASFRQTLPGSRKAHSFHHVGTSGRLYVFEAPIDMLSYISMNPENWREHSYVALCGVSICPVERFLDTYPQLSEVVLCLDNDEGGHKATRRIAKQLLEEWDGLTVSAEIPDLKDWNEDLIASQLDCEIYSAITM